MSMTDAGPARRYRFGTFEANVATGELRRKGLRVKLNAQPFQMLCLLLERPGELLTREEICRELWPDGTFVDYEHGVNSAVNRIREALGDTAGNPRFVETLARRGCRRSRCRHCRRTVASARTGRVRRVAAAVTYLLDTNAISDLMRAAPRIENWMAGPDRPCDRCPGGAESQRHQAARPAIQGLSGQRRLRAHGTRSSAVPAKHPQKC